MSDQVLRKSITKYTILVSSSFILILLFVSIFSYIEKSNEAEIISLNIRNDLIVGDHRSVHQALQNTIIGTSNLINVFNNKNELTISAYTDQNKNISFHFSIVKFLGSATNKNIHDFKIVFYYSLYNPLFNSVLIWIMFAIIALPYITYEKKRIIDQMLKASELEKRQQELKWLKLSRKMFHDIRSPLASLNSISEDLHFETAANKTLFAHSITRINDIANSLLSTTQNQVIKLPEFGDINAITKEILEEKKLEHIDAIFDFIEISKSTSALFVASEIKRIFSNLINNAIESSNAKSKIKIEISHNDSFTFIDILDNGAGIPDSVLEKLGVEEITSKKSGNGIGFKDAKETLVEWGGNLEIIKTSQEGTHIRLSLKSKLEPKAYYLIDDDALVRLTWEARAKKSNISLITFKSTADFDIHKSSIDKNANIFIDSELGVVKGEDFAKQLNLEGFKNISITSGHDSSNFENLHFLKSVISKTPPF